MSKKMLYGSFVGTRWGMSYDLEDTIRKTKAEMARQGTTVGEIRAMPDPETLSWDSPTFYTCSDRVWGNDACPTDVLPVAVC